ncbi:MAG: Ku protein [Planctomycetaceae bacterium]
MAKKKAKERSQRYRASWTGELQVGLVRFSVAAINAHAPGGSDFHFHQLHAECHERIKYVKVCPVHGEVEQAEIVHGFEYAKGKYVEIETDELDAARTSAERALTIDQFIDPVDFDSIYLDGRMYYLTPIDKQDREPYQLILRACEEKHRMGIGQVVFSGKEELAAVIPRGPVLLMAMLRYAPELRDPESLIQEDKASVSSKNLGLAKDLIMSMSSDEFSIASYKDHYRSRVKELIDTKRRGHEIVVVAEEEERPVINLIEALKRSLASQSSSVPTTKSAKKATKTGGSRTKGSRPKRSKAS